MNERFETLYVLKKNLYTDASPVVVSSGVLLKDKKTDTVIVQLKFQSVSDKRIVALKVSLNAFDIAGNPITKLEEYQYLDLDVQNGDIFGLGKAIIMPDNVTRSFEVDKVTVVFDEGFCQLSGKGFRPLENQERLDSKLSEELVAQYQIDAATSGEYIPKDLGELWLCSCGTPNTTTFCASCRAKKEDIFDSYNIAMLEANLQFRRNHQKEMEEAERKQEEESQAAQRKKRAQKKRLLLIIAVGAVIVLIISAIINNLFETQKRNQTISEIESYIATEQYEQAFDAINGSNLSSDDKEVYRDKVIPLMQAQHDAIRNNWKNNPDSSLFLDLVFCDGDVNYYIGKYKIYRKENGEQTVLYEASESGYYLSSYYYYQLSSTWSIYANHSLIFLERCDINGEVCEYSIKCIDFKTGEVDTLGNSDSVCDLIKLENGCIFIRTNFWEDTEGILYNPYTQSKYVSEDAVTDEELENAVYYE